MNNILDVSDDYSGDYTAGGRDRFWLLIVMMLATPLAQLTIRSKSLIKLVFSVVMGTFFFSLLGALEFAGKNEQTTDLGTLTAAYIIGAIYGIFVSKVYVAPIAERIAKEAAAAQPISTPPLLNEPANVEIHTEPLLPQFDVELQGQLPLVADATDNASTNRRARTPSPTSARRRVELN